MVIIYAKRDIKEYIKSCEICCRSMDSRHKPLEIPDRPWTSLSMDFIIDLPSSNEFTCILVVLDRLTKMGHFIPSSEDTANAFMTHIFRLHELPNEILSVRGY